MAQLKLANGLTMDLKAKKVKNEDKEVEVVVEDELHLPVPLPRTGIKLEDLPASPSTMNAISAIISYKLLGLNDHDISIALGCTPFQLSALLAGEAYNQAYKQVVESFVRGQENTARDIIARESIMAAKQLVTIASKSRTEGNRLKASESILNRMNIVGNDQGNAMANGLVIKIVKDHSGTEEINIKVGG
jgi:hypothetical protein